MSRKSTYKTKAENKHLAYVAALGCIVCKNNGHEGTPAEIHHCSKGTGLAVRADNFHVIPLCAIHHRQGGHGVAIHAGRNTWVQKYGTEAELLAQVNAELGIAAWHSIQSISSHYNLNGAASLLKEENK